MKLIKAFLLCMAKHGEQRDKAGKRYISPYSCYA